MPRFPSIGTDGGFVLDTLAWLKNTFVGKGEHALLPSARIDQTDTASANDAVKIINRAAGKYALKIDHYANDQDAANIYHGGTGAYTSLGVGGQNTTLSTVKVTNSAPQTGGAVVFAQGTDPGRTMPIFGGDNYGTAGGATFSAHQWNGSNSPAFRAIYDAGHNHDARALWIDANHTGGNVVYINNGTPQTSGQLVNIVQPAGSTAPVVQILNSGTGDHITANNFKVAPNGNISAGALLNYSSFNNARIQVTTVGTYIDRNVGDNGSALRINNNHASSTGDVLQIQSGGTVRGRFTKAGHLAVRVNTAPADGDLVAGEAAFWVDSTNGAAQLMVKAKQADGTVRTGAVVLS